MGPMNKICFIIQSPSLFSYLNHSPTAQESDLPFFHPRALQERMIRSDDHYL